MNDKIVPGFDSEEDATLKVTLEELDGIKGGLLIHLDGYIDTYNSGILQSRIEKAIGADFIYLIFQCTNLNYVSSTGIGAFTSFLKALTPKGGELVLLQLQPKVYEVFQLLGFAQFFNVHPSLDEALDFLRSSSGGEGASIFPKVFDCPVCAKKLKASKAGRFRCSECKTILSVDRSANVLLS